MRRVAMSVVMVLTLCRPAISQITGDMAIGIIDDLSVSKLDPALPKTPFLEWLKELLGPAVKIDWELNDCGTLTGVPAIDNERDLPSCMEASIVLSDQHVLGIAIFVGTDRKGLTDTPRIANIYIENDGNVTYFKRLSELQQALSVPKKR
jgi:hypothetical protein